MPPLDKLSHAWLQENKSNECLLIDVSLVNMPPLDKLSHAWLQENKSNECLLIDDGIQPALQETREVKNLRHDTFIDGKKVLCKDENPQHQHAKKLSMWLLLLSFVNTTCPRTKNVSPEGRVAEQKPKPPHVPCNRYHSQTCPPRYIE